MVKLFGREFGEIKGAVAERILGADHARAHKRVEDKGKVSVGYGFSVAEGRVEHPANMQNYEAWASDTEVNMAINVLTDVIAPGFYTEMPEKEDSKGKKDVKDVKHPSLRVVDEYSEAVNLDEDLSEIVNQMLSKGFAPTEKVVGYDGQTDLKILPSETFYMYRDKKGTVLKYTQEETYNSPIATWKGGEMEDIILFIHRKTPRRPYGFALVEPIGSLVDGRNALNEDVIKGVHRWANPIPIMETSKSKDASTALKSAIEDRDVDEWILAYNVQKDELRWNTLTVDPSTRFIPYVELIYYQICEGLHAPLLLYLKNATEASATVMMESVDRLVSGVQRYVKRRVERYLFEPLTGKPVPRLVWGKPVTGLEKVTLTELAALINGQGLAYNQKEDLLRQFGIKLPEPDWKSGPPVPTITPFGGGNKPFGGSEKPKNEVSPEFLVEKLNDLGTALGIISANFDEGKLSITDVMKMAQRTIEAHIKRAYPVGWEPHVQEEFERFVNDKVVKKAGKSYTVRVN